MIQVTFWCIFFPYSICRIWLEERFWHFHWVTVIRILLCELLLECLISLMVISEYFMYTKSIISCDFDVPVFHNTDQERGFLWLFLFVCLFCFCFCFFNLFNPTATFYLFSYPRGINDQRVDIFSWWNVHTTLGLHITLSKAL